MTLDCFDNDDCVIDHETDREHESEKRKCVDRKSEQRKQNKRADQRHRHRAQRNERRAPALQENENDEHDERERFKECLQNFVHAFRDRKRLVERHGVIHVAGKPLLCFGH